MHSPKKWGKNSKSAPVLSWEFLRRHHPLFLSAFNHGRPKYYVGSLLTRIRFFPLCAKKALPNCALQRTREEGGSHFPSLSLSLSFPFAPETVKHKLNFLSPPKPTAAKKAEKQTDGRTDGRSYPSGMQSWKGGKKDPFLGETRRTRGWANPYPKPVCLRQ